MTIHEVLLSARPSTITKELAKSKQKRNPDCHGLQIFGASLGFNTHVLLRPPNTYGGHRMLLAQHGVTVTIVSTPLNAIRIRAIIDNGIDFGSRANPASIPMHRGRLARTL
ncbi:hypothetical protein V6N12_053405 [Hibiscus sabdariffa]|uniref:Uncharacterized protein n=1 Tax=Hibiscus sabdariffa TaxID=183260 RepID=A0ABR2D7G3_9ROSI